jgi:parallel beta-helix repeat protein
MAPPFELLAGVEPGMKSTAPVIHGFWISGFTIRGFRNNGLFTENVDGFAIVDVESIDNKNYGIFPTLSRNGVISHSRASGADDSGIWVETSERVQVTHNLVEGNVNGFEVSNSDDVLLAHNVVRHNTIGMAILFLPDIFDERPAARRITIRKNWIHDNNKPNTATPGSILASVPAGTGILQVGVDDSKIERNRVERNDFLGIGIADYCLVVLGSPFDCSTDASVPPGFLLEQGALNNRVARNTLVANGTNPDPSHPFAFAASDLGLFTVGDGGNCYEENVFTTFFSTLMVLPACE